MPQVFSPRAWPRDRARPRRLYRPAPALGGANAGSGAFAVWRAHALDARLGHAVSAVYRPRQGAQCVDVDGHVYTDFLSGRHWRDVWPLAPAQWPPPLPSAPRAGYSCMLPGADANWVGAHLTERFGLPVGANRHHGHRRQPLCAALGARLRPAGRWWWCLMAVITARWTTPWCDKTPTAHRRHAQAGGPGGGFGQYTRVVPFNDLAALHAGAGARRRGLRCSPNRR